MERVLSVKQMVDSDNFTINHLGVPQETLVMRAGSAVAEEIIKRYHGGRVLVCIGKGNNGEDGKVIAKILSNTHGFFVTTLTVSNGIFKAFDNTYDIIVDCIFGTGLSRDVEGVYRTAIEKINKSNAKVVACDIPSGLNGDTGLPQGISVRANLTVAIQEYKLGHFLNDGPDYCGEIIAKDIGISIWEDDCVKKLSSADVKKYFPKRQRNTHKGSYGKVAIIGGSKSYSGSAMLSLNALTALKMGVGYSTLFVPESLFSVYAGVYPECIISTLNDDKGFVKFDPSKLTDTLNCKAIAIGMGIGVSEEVYKIIKFYLENYSGTLLIDADGLNTLSKFGVEVLKNKKCQVVLTPHIGEFALLTNKSKQEILSNAIGCARAFAKEYNVTLALKSATTVITDGNTIYINTTGNSALAKAGSGDVLSGISVGVLSRTTDITEGVAAACYLLGKGAEIACEGENEYVVTASNVVGALGRAINRL